MNRLSLLFAAALVFAAFPETTHAQSRSDGGWWEWAAGSDRAQGSVRTAPRTTRRDDRTRTTRRDDRRDDRNDDRDDDRYDRRDKRGDQGPKFCQNGQGHPTKGMRWCYDKGYASPRYDRRYDRRDQPQWERRTIGDIIFGTPRRDQDRRRSTMDQRVLGEILGRSAVQNLERAATGSLVGRWVQPSRNVRVLQLRDDRGPLAEMTDYDADGRVDLVLVNGQR